MGERNKEGTGKQVAVDESFEMGEKQTACFYNIKYFI
jgi:hypothetical protein